MKDIQINDENYIKIQGWMVSKLNLKGNELYIFAIIYYFCQHDNRFTGGNSYLAKWTNSTEQGCIKNLKSLLDKRLIIKDKTYSYNNSSNYLVNWKTLEELSIKVGPFYYYPEAKLEEVKEIMTYYNEKTSQNYKSIKEFSRKINNWFIQGFKVEDFKKVIDIKTEEWKNTDGEYYLRPSTLFGDKFEDYLNQKGKMPIWNNSKYFSDNCFNHDTSDEPKFNEMTKEQKEKWMDENLAKDENGNFLVY